MKKTFIYSISDENDNIRYIGKSNNPFKRIYSHINESKNSEKKNHKHNWINSLLNRGIEPKIDILDEVLVSEWQFWEKFWISLIKSWGFNLLNSTIGGEGGEGYHHSIESREKMKKSKIGRKLTEEHRYKISKSIKEKSKNDINYNKCYDKIYFIDRDELYIMYIIYLIGILYI